MHYRVKLRVYDFVGTHEIRRQKSEGMNFGNTWLSQKSNGKNFPFIQLDSELMAKIWEEIDHI